MELLSKSKENGDAEASSLHVFDVDIPYNPARVVWPDTTKLHMSREGINLSTDNFTMKLHGTESSLQKKSVVGIH